MLAVLNALQRLPWCNEWSDGVWTDSLLPVNMVFCQHLHYIVSTIAVLQSCCFLFISWIHPFNCSYVGIQHSAAISSSLILSSHFCFANPPLQKVKNFNSYINKLFLRDLKISALKHYSFFHSAAAMQLTTPEPIHHLPVGLKTGYSSLGRKLLGHTFTVPRMLIIIITSCIKVGFPLRTNEKGMARLYVQSEIAK